MSDQVTLTIDGTPVTVPKGTLLVEAAKSVATDVPVYCYHPKLGPAGLCRICLVEIEKMPKLQIACNTAVTEGMVVHTYGQKVEDGRRAVMEFLLVNHPLDCPICDKGGECDLQDFSMAYGQGASRLGEPKSKKPKAIDLGPTIVLDDERCIVCQRCSRFDEIVTNERSLVVKDRGQRDVIATASGEPYRSNFSGNVTELCPVGALTSKTYRFRSRPWDNRRTRSTCTQCAVGCQINVDERYGDVQRTMSVPTDDAVSDGWLCDRGRYNLGFLTNEHRIASPLLRSGGEFVQIAWDDAIELWATKIREAIAAGGSQSVAVLGGGRLLNEELVLLARTFGSLGVTNVDWRAGRQRQATPGRFSGSYVDLENAQAIVSFGRPAAQTAPVLDLRIRKAVTRNGARYVNVGVHASESFVAARDGATPDEARDLIRDARRVAILWDGIDLAVGARAAALADDLAAAGVAVSTFVAGEQSNARGAEALGLLASSDAIVRSASEGSLRVLSLFGVNPVLNHPLGERAIRDALANVPFVVASDLFPTETVLLADLVLPARSAFEKDGHVYDLAGDLLLLEAAHAAPEGTLGDGEMLIALADRLDLAIPTPAEIVAAATERVPAATFSFGDARFAGGTAGSETRAASADGATLRCAVAADIFAGGGTGFFDERVATLRPRPTATVAPQTAATLGLATGARLDLRGAREGVVRDLVVRIEETALPGIVRIVDGLPEAPANGFADGDYVTIENVRAAADLEALAVGSR